MKKLTYTYRFVSLVVIAMLAITALQSVVAARPAAAQGEETPGGAATLAATKTPDAPAPEPSTPEPLPETTETGIVETPAENTQDVLQQENTPQPTATQFNNAQRPLVVIESYRLKPDNPVAGENFELIVKLTNQGQVTASNLIVTFAADNVLPRKTGGVLAIAQIPPGETERVEQPMATKSDTSGIITLSVNVRYNDASGAQYDETFTLTMGIGKKVVYSGPALPTATPTPAIVFRPQLVISSYKTNSEALQPGTRFDLSIQVTNQGNTDAKRVTMVVGGATITVNPDNNNNGNPGVNASGGDFKDFSPIGASNVQFLGDLPVAGRLSATQPLIVNASTEPGAYSLKISFVYSDEKGQVLLDDQVITLLVYTPPLVDISFYRPPDPFFAGQMSALPIQIVNLGRKSTLLGNLRVSAPDADVQNGTMLVGVLDPGGYLTLDAGFMPYNPGTMEVQVEVEYTDDFNIPQRITKTIQVEVMEAPVFEPPPDGEVDPGSGEGMPEPQPETAWQKFVRFLRGLFGLGSGVSEPQPAMEPEMPAEMPPQILQ